MTELTLIGHLARHVETGPERLAVAIGTRGITYGQLWKSILSTAYLLQEEGIKPGDRVMVAAPREPEFLYAYFACHILRAIVVPYDPDMVPSRFASMIEALRPSVILTNRTKSVESQECRSIFLGTVNQSVASLRADKFVEPNSEEPADILLTSGTTGKPKGVILTHRNILAAARNINQFIGNTQRDREALALPLSHSFGLGRMRCQIVAGGSVILAPSFQFPKDMFKAMKHWSVTGFSFVPAGWSVLRRLTGDRLIEFADSLRYIEIGSAPMPRSEKEHLMRLFPRTRICMHYGLTEASRSAFIEFHASKDRLDSIGKPAPNVEIRIVDDKERDLEPGQIGRIEIRGDHVMGSYWEADVSERLRRGWFRSRDLGYRDQEGYLYISGREDDVINVGGRKVHPTEVEQALLRHEHIADALCVGVPDTITGEAVRAFLVAKCDNAFSPNAEALTHFLRQNLDRYKIPVAFEWVPSIPRNSSGKIDRKAAADLAGKSAVRIDAGGHWLMQTSGDHPAISGSGGVADDRSNNVSLRDHDPEFYYDRVMPAWRLIMGRNLHYGYFQGPKQELDAATDNLTLRMAKYAELDGGLELLDIGCGDGQNSCFLAEHFDCRIVGISTGRKGVEEANRLSRTRGLSQRVTFLLRDGMNNGFLEGLFDRVWVMQSSHFMLDKRRLFHECVRVLRPGGRVVLGDIMLRIPLPRIELMRQREKFLLLHRVFGRAKMEPLQVYQSLAEECGLRVDVAEDISAQTFPTFERWRQNAMVHRDEIIALIGETLWRDFLSACDVLEGFWERGWLGYGILAGDRPLESVAAGAEP